jgi:hypothetical protein
MTDIEPGTEVPERPKVQARDVIARMDPEDAKALLGEIAEFLASEVRLNRDRAESQRLLAASEQATLSQREQATGRWRAHHVAAVAHDIGLQRLIMWGLKVNAKRDREVLGEQPEDRDARP